MVADETVFYSEWTTLLLTLSMTLMHIHIKKLFKQATDTLTRQNIFCIASKFFF